MSTKVKVVTAAHVTYEQTGEVLQKHVNEALEEIGPNSSIDISYEQTVSNGNFYMTAFIQHRSKF